MNWLHLAFLIFLAISSVLTQINSIQKGESIGCFKRSEHNKRESLRYTKNCFDFCANHFYRYSVLHDSTCYCENILKEAEVEKEKCNKKCPTIYGNDTEVICGGDEVESYYGSGSNLPGAARNLMLNSTRDDKILLTFESPERNGTELTGFEAHAIVLSTYSKNLWASRNHTKKIVKFMNKLEFSDLTPSTEYNISIISMNGDAYGGTVNIIAKTNLAAPDPPPDPPKIFAQRNNQVSIEISRASNNNGPVSNYLVVVHFVDDELIHDFDASLLTDFQKAQDDGLSYYISAEIDPFLEDTKTFIVGDGVTYGRFFNAPIPSRHFHILIGVVSRVLDEEMMAFSTASHEDSNEILTYDSSTDESDIMIIFLTIACVICGLILVGSIIFYGYIKTRINPRRMTRLERHEMSLQGPILEVDNNGFISDVSGFNFKEKLQEVLLSLDDDQKIIRKNLSLDIDNILGIGAFGDVIRGQLNTNIPSQVHVVSADDMDPPIQTKFIRDLNNLLQFGFHKNMLNFMGICQTHDWFFVVFEDTPATLKQFLIGNRQDVGLSSNRVTNLGENEILRLMYELSETIEYLRYNKIVHKNLNSHTVRIKRQNSAYTIKLSVFGPTLYYVGEDGSKSMIDEERWQAPEVMRFQKYSHASDVYSFGLVLWEMSCLGGTVYGSLATSDLFVRIKKGLRPDKFPFISEDLYQLMLNCWELDPHDRIEINEATGHLKQLQTSPHYYLNFNYDGQLPYYLPLLEIKN